MDPSYPVPSDDFCTIDYDHALMVTMASWDSGDVRPEAGPAAGDWNPS